MRWTKYNGNMPEQHAAELHWRHSSDKSPLHMKQHVVLDKLIVEYEAGRYKYDLNNLEYLDESLPASIEQEAERLYPEPPGRSREQPYYDHHIVDIQRSAYLAAASRYQGDLSRLQAENSKLRAALDELELILSNESREELNIIGLLSIATEALK